MSDVYNAIYIDTKKQSTVARQAGITNNQSATIKQQNKKGRKITIETVMDSIVISVARHSEQSHNNTTVLAHISASFVYFGANCPVTQRRL